MTILDLDNITDVPRILQGTADGLTQRQIDDFRTLWTKLAALFWFLVDCDGCFDMFGCPSYYDQPFSESLVNTSGLWKLKGSTGLHALEKLGDGQYKFAAGDTIRPFQTHCLADADCEDRGFFKARQWKEITLF